MTSAPAAAPTAAPPAARRRATFHPLTVAAVARLTDDAAAITFAVPDELRAAYAFAPGQNLVLRRTVAGREERRSYSVCAPAGTPPRIGVREIPDGLFSSWLVHDVRPGDVVEVQTPTGSFAADPAAGGRHLCIAAGSGITPVLSIAATVLAHPEARVTLVYGNRTTGSVMFAEELADLKDRHGPRLDLVHVLSREPRDVELFSGRLDADRLHRLLTALVPVAGLDHAWLCGPLGMVTDARAVLADLGVAPERVHAELFHVDEPPLPLVRSEAVLEGEVSEVTVVLDGRTTTTTAARTTTVLDAAAVTRHDLPFACRGGVCGTCRARVVAGEVDLRRNYALDDDELARGFVLTCQSYPAGDRVTVDFDA
ncbi:1,2-phenylacetyl-CoA epoxidase subunit PaaE [Nocardioides sp. SYSU D00038]|uniref:1,2-phenylacetyl-CoA epoxidase subunit PaaE n=1 Tax=Nocardioides sp. SYSU D00038 TaxID=2812554 RepID=UPI00196862B2|nr:1,2-phenylacetyl-CoA epoxidase subunit PaaE [Nocardioides sp. SYSU D00038]